MQIYFEKEEDVAAKVKELTIICEDKHCPLINKQCKGEKCAAFYIGGYTQRDWAQKKEKFVLHSPGCSSPLITGAVELEQ